MSIIRTAMQRGLLLCALTLSAVMPVVADPIEGIVLANRDGSYTLFGSRYRFEDFPYEDLVVVNNTVQVFPEEGASLDSTLPVVKRLARTLIRKGYDVETRVMGQVVPYIVKRTPL